MPRLIRPGGDGAFVRYPFNAVMPGGGRASATSCHPGEGRDLREDRHEIPAFAGMTMSGGDYPDEPGNDGMVGRVVSAKRAEE